MDATDWDARYAGTDLVWSAAPNMWVRELTSRRPSGRALDVAAGEGRNALWLVEQGWTVTATDFSSVAVQRMSDIADQRLGSLRARLTTLVGDATADGEHSAYDLVLLCYLHLPDDEWRAAMRAATTAARPGGHVLVIGHALRNLTEGVGGPQDPSILLDPEGVLASIEGLPVEVELAEIRERSVEGADRPALDTVALLRRT
ncbi:MAG: class I SAM-dependent methyltransferase [Dermatophilaceae bacterium]|jgi:SAM-dependent methyltransferase